MSGGPRKAGSIKPCIAAAIALLGRSGFQAIAAITALAVSASPAHADQKTVSGNNGTLTATAQLRFSIGISKFVMLRLGNADATQSDLTFNVRPTPAGPGNRLAYAGAVAPSLATTIATTNPTSTAGVLAVSAFTNVAGTTLSCAITPLAGATAFAAGATAAGVPGRADIKVVSTASGVIHPGADLSACNGTTTTAITSLTVQTGTFVYSTSYVAGSLNGGTFGNIVTYTAAAP